MCEQKYPSANKFLIYGKGSTSKNNSYKNSHRCIRENQTHNLSWGLGKSEEKKKQNSYKNNIFIQMWEKNDKR